MQMCRKAAVYSCSLEQSLQFSAADTDLWGSHGTRAEPLYTVPHVVYNLGAKGTQMLIYCATNADQLDRTIMTVYEAEVNVSR